MHIDIFVIVAELLLVSLFTMFTICKRVTALLVMLSFCWYCRYGPGKSISFFWIMFCLKFRKKLKHLKPWLVQSFFLAISPRPTCMHETVNSHSCPRGSLMVSSSSCHTTGLWPSHCRSPCNSLGEETPSWNTSHKQTQTKTISSLKTSCSET